MEIRILRVCRLPPLDLEKASPEGSSLLDQLLLLLSQPNPLHCAVMGDNDRTLPSGGKGEGLPRDLSLENL